MITELNDKSNIQPSWFKMTTNHQKSINKNDNYHILQYTKSNWLNYIDPNYSMKIVSLCEAPFSNKSKNMISGMPHSLTSSIIISF